MHLLQKTILFTSLCGLLLLLSFSGAMAMSATRPAIPQIPSDLHLAEKPLKAKKQLGSLFNRQSELIPDMLTLVALLTVLGLTGLIISLIKGGGGLLLWLSIAALSVSVLVFILLMVLMVWLMYQMGNGKS